MATTIPFVALAGLGLVAAERLESIRNLPGMPIPDPVASSLGARNERLLIRNLVEAHFFEHGRYPQTLAEVAGQASEAGAALTDSRLGAYYYAVRGDEVVLLAPRHTL